MNKPIFLSLLVSILLLGCKKDPSSEPVATEPSAYFPLSIGSYWVYELIEMDLNGIVKGVVGIDSAYIAHDTVINGHNYFAYKSKIPLFWDLMLRDSLGYLVTPEGHIYFAPEDFSDPLDHRVAFLGQGQDSFYVYTNRMEKMENGITVPAGHFEALALRQSFELKTGARDTRVFLDVRSPGVGAVMQQFGPAIAPRKFERRLLRYHLTP